MKIIRVLLADDHNLLRAGIRLLLQNMEGIEVVGEARDGQEAFNLVKKLRPDILLCDISMPRMNGLELVQRLARECPRVRSLILSMHANEEYICQALQTGAAGYLLKDSATIELESALRAVAREETYLSPAVSQHLLKDYLSLVGGNKSTLGLLTARQREVLRLIAQGRSTKEIAACLGISAKTVETHRLQLMERLDIHDVAGLVRFALKAGVVNLEE